MTFSPCSIQPLTFRPKQDKLPRPQHGLSNPCTPSSVLSKLENATVLGERMQVLHSYPKRATRRELPEESYPKKVRVALTFLCHTILIKNCFFFFFVFFFFWLLVSTNQSISTAVSVTMLFFHCTPLVFCTVKQ